MELGTLVIRPSANIGGVEIGSIWACKSVVGALPNMIVTVSLRVDTAYFDLLLFDMRAMQVIYYLGAFWGL